MSTPVVRSWIDTDPTEDSVNSILFASAILLHGPIDIGITAAMWHLETNPIVADLGLVAWLSIKLALLAITTVLFFDGYRFNPRPYPRIVTVWLTCLVWLGLLFILPNAGYLAGFQLEVIVS